MLHHDMYVREKLREYEREMPLHLDRLPESKPRRALVIGPAARGMGRLLCRVGTGLEAWAGREPELRLR